VFGFNKKKISVPELCNERLDLFESDDMKKAAKAVFWEMKQKDSVNLTDEDYERFEHYYIASNYQLLIMALFEKQDSRLAQSSYEYLKRKLDKTNQDVFWSWDFLYKMWIAASIRDKVIEMAEAVKGQLFKFEINADAISVLYFYLLKADDNLKFYSKNIKLTD